jgi:hypothetical protein
MFINSLTVFILYSYHELLIQTCSNAELSKKIPNCFFDFWNGRSVRRKISLSLPLLRTVREYEEVEYINVSAVYFT